MVTALPTPVLQSNPVHVGAAALRAKQLSLVAQHPTTVVCDVVDVYAGVHEETVAAHE